MIDTFDLGRCNLTRLQCDEGGRGPDLDSSQHSVQLPLSLSDLMPLSIECSDSWVAGDGACGLADIGEQDRLTSAATGGPALARRNPKLSVLAGSMGHHDGRRGCGRRQAGAGWTGRTWRRRGRMG